MPELRRTTELSAHRYYRYRACAALPDNEADFPGQALGDPDLHIDAWSATDVETQRKAAAACHSCPVREACRVSALTGGPQPEAPHPHAVLGGLLPDQLAARRPTAAQARNAFENHPHLRYKGCASSPLDPKMSLGDAQLPVDAWNAPDIDGGEDPEQRTARETAVKRVCAACPVLIECRTYATSLTPAGLLTEPDGIMGGLTSLERHRGLVKQRAARPIVTAAEITAQLRLEEARTAQKQAVLAALARETTETRVAEAAGMDVRTANWQRAILCGLLGLDKETATRGDLLKAAEKHGVLPEGVKVRSDGPWPIAAAPDTTGVRQRRLAPKYFKQRALLESYAREVDEEKAGYQVGLSVRTAEAQRAELCDLLGLNRSASRMELLRTAQAAGALRGLRIKPDPDPAAPWQLPLPVLRLVPRQRTRPDTAPKTTVEPEPAETPDAADLYELIPLDLDELEPAA